MKSKITAAIAAIASIALLGGCTAGANEVNSVQTLDHLVFAGVALDGSTEISDSYQLIVDEYSKEFGVPVTLFEASDPAAIQAAFAAGKVDIASFTGIDYWVQRKLTKNFEMLGVSTSALGATPGVKSIGFARKSDSTVNSLADLKDKTICNSNNTSAGYFAASYALLESGLTISEDSSADVLQLFSGSGANSVAAVDHKNCDVAFLTSTTVKGIFAGNPELKQSNFKQIWESELVPGSGLIISTRLSQAIRDRIKTFTLEELNKTAFVEKGLCADEPSCLFLNKSNWGYTEAPEGYYDIILEFCRKVDPKNCPTE